VYWNWNRLRPLVGMLSTMRLSMVAVREEVSVCSSGASPVTVMLSVTAPSSSRIGSPSRSEAARAMFSRTNFLKPVFSAVST